jgi:CRP/FNR family transcriptional regulator, cyclic AMP receptor protein
MSQSSLVEMLQANPWFGSLSREHFETFIGLSTERRWPAGHVIFREGERDDRLYLVLEGRVALEIHVPARGRVTILTIGPDEIFGWSAAVPGVQTRTASARAVQATYGIACDAAALRAACERDHDLGYHVYRRLTNVIAGRLTATRLQLLDIYAVEQKG